MKRNKKILSVFAAILLFVLIFSSSTYAQVIFEDSFNDGNLTQPDWTTAIGAAAADPEDSNNMVLQCPAGPTTRTHSGMTGDMAPCSDIPLEMALKFNLDYAGDRYANFWWSLRTTNGEQDVYAYDWNSSGYGFRVLNDKKTFWIYRFSKDGAGAGKVGLTEIATITLPSSVMVPGWNTAKFVWGEDGKLSLYINESEVLTAFDSTYAPGLAQIAYRGFVNNTADSNGKYMYFDDIKVNESVVIPEPPAQYIHPNILFGPEDLPSMRNRLEQSAVGRRTMQCIKGWVDLALLNENAPLKNVYQALISEDIEELKTYTDSWWKANLSLALSLHAFDCMIRDDSTHASDLAAALTTYAKITSGRINVPGFTGVISTDVNIGYSYDFIYNYMTEEQRQIVRSAIAIATKGKTLHYMDDVKEVRNNNGVPYGTQLMQLAIAIEGEEGYDPNLYNQALELMNDFFTYGIYSTGAPAEDMHYLNFGMSYGASTLVAMARRGDVLYDNSNYKALKNWYIHSMESFGNSFSTLGDTPNDSGGLVPNYVLMKWLNPEDPVIDFIWRNRVRDDYTGIRYRGDFLFTAIFGLDWNGGENTEKAPVIDSWGADNISNPPVVTIGEWNPAALGLSNSFSDFNRGLFITRTDWSRDAMKMEFETNSHAVLPSHTHSNSNDFTLSAFGQKWAIDRGYHIFESRDHSIIQIDGKGQGFFPAYGKTVGFLDSQLATVSIGDAKNVYDYRYTFKSRLNNDENKGYSWEFEPKSPRPETSIVSTYRALENPVDNAFRTAMMIRGSNPYVLIIDDIQKDQNEHLYEWLMQVPNELEEKSILGSDIVLGLDDEKADSPRLLVRSMQAAVTVDPTMRDTYIPARLETYEVKNSSKTGYSEKFGLGKRVVISSRSASPDFKTLLFPYKPGTVMPTTTWQVPGSQLTVEWAGQKDEFTFQKLPDGRTGFGMVRNSGQSFLTTGLTQFGPVYGISITVEGEGPNIALDDGILNISGTGWGRIIVNAANIDQVVSDGSVGEIILMATGVELIEKTVYIDETPPDIVFIAPEDGKEYILNDDVTVSWKAVDIVSGIASSSATVPDGSAMDTGTVGSKTFNVKATDLAGNTAAKAATYYVRYKYSGVLKPIEEDGSSTFKGGNIPVKFRLQDAKGNYISSAAAKLYMTKIEDGVEGQEIEAPSKEGNSFRYENEDNCYIFNLETKNIGNGRWKLRILLDDGTSKYVVITVERK